MWEAEREFEIYQDLQDYELEDDGADDFADLEFLSSGNHEGGDPDYDEDIEDGDPDY